MIIGSGIDIVEVKRLKKSLTKWGGGFLKKVFTDREIKAAKKRKDWFQHLAGRFAAKEAVFKALDEPKLWFSDIEVMNDKDGKPVCLLSEKFKNLNHKNKIVISISHSKNYAVASAVVEKKT
jgi:holo-[acyl-carrier protein] synthase